MILSSGTPQILSNPSIQWGFAGFCLALLAFVFWLVKTRTVSGKDLTTVISEHTSAVREQTRLLTELLQLNRKIHNRLLARPCLLPKNGDDKFDEGGP